MKSIVKYTLRTLLVIFLFLVACFFIFRDGDLAVDELKKKYANEHSQFIEVQGTQTHYRIEGDGNHHVLLIHGTGASLHTWDGWVAEMKDSFRLIRLDLPAFGLTGPHPERDYSMDRYVGYVDDFMEAVGVDSFSIAGNSLGGNIAWNYTIAHPDKVQKLILVDAAGYPEKESASVFRLAQSDLTAPLLKHITPRSFIKKNLLEVYGQANLLTDATIDRYHDMALREGNRQAFIDRVRTRYDDRSNLISSITHPTLIMWGMKDSWTDPRNAKKFAEDIKGSILIEYPALGHVPMEEDPTTSVRDVIDFMRR